MAPQSGSGDSGGLILQGRGTAPGFGCGPLCRNRPDLEPSRAEDTILVAERAVPDDVGRILASAGTLTLGGALLSHVSLLSREFGRPSVSLAGSARVRLLDDPADGLLELGDVVGASGPPRLREGDVVVLDGNAGTVAVPGGVDPDRRDRVRSVIGPLRSYGRHQGDEGLLEALLSSLSKDTSMAGFVLEGAMWFGLVPAGEPSRRLIRALRELPGIGDGLESKLAQLRRRLLDKARRRSGEVAELIAAATEMEDLERHVRGYEEEIEGYRALVVDLGGSPSPLGEWLGSCLRSASSRRRDLRDGIRKQAAEVLEMEDAALESRVGGLYRLVRRARSAGLDPEVQDRLKTVLARQVARQRERAGAHLVVPVVAGSPPRDRGLVGGKAAGLLQVLPILPEGAAVPPGFVVTTSAYRLHLLGGAGERIREAAESAGDEASISRRARAAILGSPVPEEVVEAVRSALQALPPGRLAVRSSASIEDGASGSLAGQFDTVLGVETLDTLVERIRWAWASLWNARALRMLAATGRSPLSAAQAVLVQEMVETSAAGVLFSREPGGRPDTVLVNAAWGLGEGISQGEVPGDLFWVRRSTGELLASENGAGRFTIELDPERDGTVEVELPESRRRQLCLEPGELRRLAELALVLEESTGRSQDVEFGFRPDGTLFVFQVRRVVPRRPH